MLRISQVLVLIYCTYRPVVANLIKVEASQSVIRNYCLLCILLNIHQTENEFEIKSADVGDIYTLCNLPLFLHDEPF
jgi:hypothetical protein